MGFFDSLIEKGGTQESVFEMNLDHYNGSFSAWFLNVRNPLNPENGHAYWETTFFTNELEFVIMVRTPLFISSKTFDFSRSLF